MFSDVSCGIGSLDFKEDFFREVCIAGPDKATCVLCTLGDWSPRTLGGFAEEEVDGSIDEVIIECLVFDDERTGFWSFAGKCAEDSGAWGVGIDLDPGVGESSGEWATGGESIAADDDHGESEEAIGFDFDFEGAFTILVGSPEFPRFTLV